jgi:lipopolysaccharide transport system ATP-binding protein
MSDPVIRLVDVGKMYKIFSSRRDNLVDAVGFGRALSRRQPRYREFWALRGIDLTVERGARIGVIGRNGAGKSTLLKLITGALALTEGTLEVNGTIQALIDAGAGFHPEFTGYENINASLTYQGFSREELATAREDIEEFTELGEFLEQPLKTYSLGMQARLAFATATAIKPEILVVDEVLGAGDAYFITKSVERMNRITSTGASMLIVSHSLAQITQLCDDAIWLERGRIVARGRSIDVVKQYERYVRELEEARLRDRNLKRSKGTFTSLELDQPTGTLQIRLEVVSGSGTSCEVARMKIIRDAEPVETVDVGAPQDGNPEHAAFVDLAGSNWSAPQETDGLYTRALTRDSDKPPTAGSIVFNLFHFEESSAYEVEVDYRCKGDAVVAVEAIRGAESMPLGEVSGNGGTWQTARFPIRGFGATAAPEPASRSFSHVGRDARLSYWPGENSLRIATVSLTNAAGQECTVFNSGERLTLTVAFEAQRTDSYQVLPVAVIYRLDGVNISTQMGEWVTAHLEPGTSHRASVTLDDLNLGNGNYLVSIALYKSFDPDLHESPVVYDWVDRSIEFQVVGTPIAITSVFQHPSVWRLH